MSQLNRQLKLNKSCIAGGDCVVYVMSRDQRVKDNHALIAACEKATELKVPIVVLFNLLNKTGVRSQEHYRFMVDGLKNVEQDLVKLNIPFVVKIGDPFKNISNLVSDSKAHSVYFDFNPLRGVRSLQKKIAKNTDAQCIVVDTHNVIPVWVISDKEEFAAHTIRNKVHKNLDTWLVEPKSINKHEFSFKQKPTGESWQEVDSLVSSIPASGININFKSGEAEASNLINNFIQSKLKDYAANRNIPTDEGQSNLSPYLHFGQISSLRVALLLTEEVEGIPLLFEKGKLASFEGEPTKLDSVNSLLEEMIVRKELADNYCFYNQNYDNLSGAKPWVTETLRLHENDDREYIYSLEDWEEASTHDAAWNAAQQEMMQTGKMHGYMRMYWAKKILEWSETPAKAIEIAIYLNDKYSIDGGDPNGYTGIMWSIAGVHDRPWFERDIFGKIRYMNAAGLKRKFDIEMYISRWLTT